ncbi:hypothetical protein JCM19000A_03900 [Silvimonas sp. JCM 19000]
MVRLFSFVLAVGALCCEGAAHADSVNKCKDARGRTVYQSDPCEVSGAHFVKAVTAPPRLNGETASAVQLASAQPVADSITPECRLLREDKKRNEDKARLRADAWLKADHDWIVKRMATISCQPE